MEELEFSPLERKIYDSIYFSAKKDFDRLDAKGLVSKNYTHILAMLMRYLMKLSSLRSCRADYVILGCDEQFFILVLLSAKETRNGPCPHKMVGKESQSTILFRSLRMASNLERAVRLHLSKIFLRTSVAMISLNVQFASTKWKSRWSFHVVCTNCMSTMSFANDVH